MPAASVRAFREFAERVGINSFTELRSDQGVGRGRKIGARTPKLRAILKIGRRERRLYKPVGPARVILKIEVARRASSVSAGHEAAGRLTRELSRPSDRSLIFFERARKPRWFLKSPGGASQRRFVMSAADGADVCPKTAPPTLLSRAQDVSSDAARIRECSAPLSQPGF
jgi:hypothetical protein